MAGCSLSLLEAWKDLRDLGDPYVAHIALIGLDCVGQHRRYSHRAGERHLYMTQEMSEPGEGESRYIRRGEWVPRHGGSDLRTRADDGGA